MSAWTIERARVASLTRSRKPDDPELVEARRRLRVARLADQVGHGVTDVRLTTDEAASLAASILTRAGAAW